VELGEERCIGFLLCKEDIGFRNCPLALRLEVLRTAVAAELNHKELAEEFLDRKAIAVLLHMVEELHRTDFLKEAARMDLLEEVDNLLCFHHILLVLHMEVVELIISSLIIL
jgi:hypothetical protein